MLGESERTKCNHKRQNNVFHFERLQDSVTQQMPDRTLVQHIFQLRLFRQRSHVLMPADTALHLASVRDSSFFLQDSNYFGDVESARVKSETLNRVFGSTAHGVRCGVDPTRGIGSSSRT